MTRRQAPVAVTGLGVVAPHGDDVAIVFDALCSGRSAIARYDDHMAAATCTVAPDRWYMDRTMAGIDRTGRLALGAADAAVKDALRHGAATWDERRTGVYVGTGFGGAGSVDAAYARFHRQAKLAPLSVIASMANAPAALVAMRFSARGPALTFAVACASGAAAIAQGARDIADGLVDTAIVGGSEAQLVPGMVAAWKAMQALAPLDIARPEATCKPFDRARNGFVLGEGAAFLVLEDAARARERGARVYAELAGSATTCDAVHLFKPDTRGQVDAIEGALAAAQLQPRDVGYVNAHGTGTVAGDLVEARSIRTVWGADLDRLKVSSTKGLHGHLLGAAGALEAVITVLALHCRMLPPNAGCDEPDPDIGLPLVRDDETHAADVDAALSHSFAFGGTNVVLAFRRPRAG